MLKYQKAFTLIELMITVSILAIVMALAIPSFKSSVANNRSVGAGGELVSALNFARTEAIKRGSYVSVCASDTGSSSTPTCLAAGNWAKGWLVFADDATTDAGTPVVTAAKVLRYWKDVPATAVVTAVKQTSNSDINYIRFTGMGVLARAPNDLEVRELNVSLTACRGQQKSQIIVGIAGLITSTKVNCP